MLSVAEIFLWACTGQVMLLSLILCFQSGLAYRLIAVLGVSIAGHLAVTSSIRLVYPVQLALEWIALQPLPVFYLLTGAIFRDDFRFSAMRMAPVIVLPVIGLIFIEFRESWIAVSHGTLKILLQAMPQLLLGLFLLPAAYNILSGFSQDLIPWRYRLRYYLMVFVALSLLAVLIAEIGFGATSVPQILGIIKLIVISVLTGTLSIVILKAEPYPQARQSRSVHNLNVQSESVISASDRHILESLKRSIEVEQVFLEEGLTIGQLARRLNCQQYRLRRLINQHLGHANFNQFLNRYRVEQACRWLKDPQRADHTIVRLAFDLGYQSLAPFNQAFKSITGMTPAQYRRKD